MQKEILNKLSNYFKDVVKNYPKTTEISLEQAIANCEAKMRNYKKERQALASKDAYYERIAEMAYLSKIIYGMDHENLPTYRATFERGGKPFMHRYGYAQLLEKDRPRALLLLSGYHLVLTIKGTTDLKDWIENLSITSENGFHDGYWKIATWLQSEITRLIPTEQYNELQEIFITGHSMGGAVGTVLARILNSNNKKTGIKTKVSCFTFGAPDINATIQSKTDYPALSTEFHFANAGDIIAGIGLNESYETGFLIGADQAIYKHDLSAHSKLLRLFELAKVAVNNGKIPKPALKFFIIKITEAWDKHQSGFKDFMMDIKPSFLPPDYLMEEHKIEQYIAAINKRILTKLDNLQNDPSNRFRQHRRRICRDGKS